MIEEDTPFDNVRKENIFAEWLRLWFYPSLNKQARNHEFGLVSKFQIQSVPWITSEKIAVC